MVAMPLTGCNTAITEANFDPYDSQQRAALARACLSDPPGISVSDRYLCHSRRESSKCASGYIAGGPIMAPQRVEKIESALGNGNGPESLAPPRSGAARCAEVSSPARRGRRGAPPPRRCGVAEKGAQAFEKQATAYNAAAVFWRARGERVIAPRSGAGSRHAP